MLLLKKYAKEFERVFNMSLKESLCWHGFDIIAFDRDIGTPDGISTKDYLEKKYGKEGMDIVAELINS